MSSLSPKQPSPSPDQTRKAGDVSARPDQPAPAQPADVASILALQRTAGNQAVVRCLAANRPMKAPRTIQRYTEIPPEALEPENRPLGAIWMSEGQRFFRRARAERELWAQADEIRAAKAITSHKSGILDLDAGDRRTVMAQEFRRVAVSNRAAPKSDGGSGEGDKSKAESSPQVMAHEPFTRIMAILNEHGKGTLGTLIAETKKAPNPYRYGTYEQGAFEAIRTQFGLEIGKQIDAADNGKAHRADAAALKEFLKSWQDRIGEVNSEASHRFQFMVTECGGFSQMVSPSGAEGTQATVEAGDRMRTDLDESIPGPWRNHYAAVIMTDGPDRATLESAAGMDKWWFGVYGSRSLDQTFVMKTLLAKLDIGSSAGQGGAVEAGRYVRAVLAGDQVGAEKCAETLDPALREQLDGVLDNARTNSVPKPKVAKVVLPGKDQADGAASQRAKLTSLATRIRSSLLLPAMTADEQVLFTALTDLAGDRVQGDWQSLSAARTAEEVRDLVLRIRASREELMVAAAASSAQFMKAVSSSLRAEQDKNFFRRSQDSIATHHTRMSLTADYMKELGDLSWLKMPEIAPSGVGSEEAPKSGASGLTEAAIDVAKVPVGSVPSTPGEGPASDVASSSLPAIPKVDRPPVSPVPIPIPTLRASGEDVCAFLIRMAGEPIEMPMAAPVALGDGGGGKSKSSPEPQPSPPSKPSAPPSEAASHAFLLREDYHSIQERFADWLAANKIGVVRNGGGRSNSCLIISLVQHASRSMAEVSRETIGTYKSFLREGFGIGFDAPLNSDGAAFEALLAQINRDYGRDLKPVFAIAETPDEPAGPPFTISTGGRGSELVAIWDQLGHFEPLV